MALNIVLSCNRELSEMVRDMLKGRAEVTELDYSQVPFINQDDEYPAPQAVAEARKAVAEADGVWILDTDFRRCAHSGTWVPACHLLLNGDGWRKSLNIVAFGFVHPSEKLSRIGGQALYIASLAFGVECVESKRRLSGATHSGYHYEFVSGNLERHIFQVVHSRTLYLNMFHALK